jgi:sec-independent protein translocase protein TatA
MGEFSIFHWLVVLAVILLLFGGRKIPEVMKGIGEGIRSFKDGMSGTNVSTPQSPPVAPPPVAAPPVTPPVTPVDERK